MLRPFINHQFLIGGSGDIKDLLYLRLRYIIVEGAPLQQYRAGNVLYIAGGLVPEAAKPPFGSYPESGEKAKRLIREIPGSLPGLSDRFAKRKKAFRE